MTKVFLAVTGILILIILILILIIAIMKSKLKETSHDMAAVISVNHSLMNEVSNLHKEIEIKNGIQKETQDKINMLHTGNTVDNAISGLSEHQKE